MAPWSLPPTGVVGGAPTGRQTTIKRKEDDTVRRSLELENEGAVIVAAKGYRVHQNPTKPEIAEARRLADDTGDPQKDPDYLIEGYVFDCYAPTPGKSVRSVWSGVSDKVRKGQTQRVLLNLQDWGGSVAELKKQFDDWPVPRLKELAALKPDGTTIQIVRRD